MDFDISEYSKKAVDMAVEYAPKFLLAIITLIVGFWLIKQIVKLLEKALNSKGLDVSLSKFLVSLATIIMKIMLFLSVASMFGINTTSIVAIIGALSVGIGMALNGSIGHLVSGIMLLMFKPFKVNDLVKIGDGHIGTVEAINAFNTTLKTLDNSRIIIGNSNVTNNTITNISGQGEIGVELSFGIAYDDDIDRARDIILEVGRRCPFILDQPKQEVVVGELADSAVMLNTRPFCISEHYWDTRFYMLEEVKKEFDKAGIGIPFPQMDIHMKTS